MNEDYDELLVHLAMHLAEVLDTAEAKNKGAYDEAMQALCDCQGVSMHTAVLLVLAFKGGAMIGEMIGNEVVLSMN
jgi:hypothetical protein